MNNFTSFKNWLNETKKTDKTEYGCVMLFATIPDWEDRLKIINKEDIFDDETKDYGLEHETHVTLLYGIHLDETKPEKIKKFIETFNSIDVSINEISCFENENYDVVKYDVPVTKELKEYHDAILANYPNTQTFPDYHPHMTISYVIPGTGKKYSKKIKPFNVKFDTVIYSYNKKGESKRTKIKIKLEDESKVRK